jgi:hypothetical protein
VSRVGVTVEGGLFAADLIERIALGDTNISGQQPKDFGLDAGRLSAEIQSAFSDIRLFWDGYKRRREVSQASPVSLTREAWAIPLFERIGYALRFQRPAPQIGGQSYPISHRTGEAENSTPVHIVAFEHKLGERGDARRSPHALLQEYLNHTDALWGIVTNGRELRLLRNSARSSRPSYLAVDLETILDGNLYNEFALVYRVLHRSRLPRRDREPHDCLLETWYQQGIEEGGRVRKDLRVGVKAALETLGSGFLRHPTNDELRKRLNGNGLTEGQFYRELLNLIYRLLFLMVAEERKLLITPATNAAARHDVYLRWYGIGRLRERVEKRTGDDGYCDLWEGLKETFRLFREERAAEKLALSALNGELFGDHRPCRSRRPRHAAEQQRSARCDPTALDVQGADGKEEDRRAAAGELCWARCRRAGFYIREPARLPSAGAARAVGLRAYCRQPAQGNRLLLHPAGAGARIDRERARSGYGECPRPRGHEGG